MLELELNLLGMLLISDHQSQLLPGISIWELSTPEHPPLQQRILCQEIKWGRQANTGQCSGQFAWENGAPMPGCNPCRSGMFTN